MDIITYWSNAKSSGHPLAQMALDFLSVPGMSVCCSSGLVGLYISATSTDVERAFSQGGLTVSKLRHSLSDKSTLCFSVLGVTNFLD